MSDDPHASLRKYFTVQDEKQSWKLRCNKCSSTWRLQKREDGQPPGGSILHLINHAYSHE
jgi:hypothetical protein